MGFRVIQTAQDELPIDRGWKILLVFNKWYVITSHTRVNCVSYTIEPSVGVSN